MAVSITDYNLEYRCSTDDAWYTCAVVLDDVNRNLRVKFRDFVQSFYDEVFSVANFSTHSEIEQFLLRFRPVSKPVEDYECSGIIQGMLVCAIYRNKDEALYFDAVVDAVCILSLT
ncbi:putative SAWADEE domain-containing protein [Helianthus annuus]|nr:putative SAWADEE domain-containing protein [Helianthus annuus]